MGTMYNNIVNNTFYIYKYASKYTYEFLRHTYMGTEKLLIKLSKKSSLSCSFSMHFFSQWSLYPKEKEYNKSTIYSLLGNGILIESTKNTRRIDST